MNRLLRVTQLVGLNSVPVVGSLWAGWSDSTALALYWCDNVMTILVVATVMILHRKITNKRGHYVVKAMKAEIESGRERSSRKKSKPKVSPKPRIQYASTRFLRDSLIFTFLPAPFVFMVAGDVNPASLQRGIAAAGIFILFGFITDLVGIRDHPYAWIRAMKDLTLWRVLFVDLAAFIGMWGLGLFHFPRSGVLIFVIVKLFTDIASQFPQYDPKKAPRWLLSFDKSGDAEGNWEMDYRKRHEEYAEDEEPFDGRPSRAAPMIRPT